MNTPLPTTSKSQIATWAVCLYTALMALGMAYMKIVRGITYDMPEMMNVMWFVMLIGTALTVFFVVRYFGWQAVGFRQLRPRQLLWLALPLAILVGMWSALIKGLVSTPLSAEQWQLFAIAGFTTFLVGVNEEIMYRGMVLHGFLTTRSVTKAMLTSAIAFSLLHAVNIFGGVPVIGVPFQLALTFLFGCFFAPLMLKLNNIVPLIIFHWLWDFSLFVAPILGEQVDSDVHRASLAFFPIEIVLAILLWLRIKKEQTPSTEPAIPHP
jgi:uncharacterized protein